MCYIHIKIEIKQKYIQCLQILASWPLSSEYITNKSFIPLIQFVI